MSVASFNSGHAIYFHFLMKLPSSGSLDNTAKIWNLQRGEMRQTVEFAENVGFVRFCHDDKWIAASCWKKEVFIVDIDIGTTICKLRSGKSKDQ